MVGAGGCVLVVMLEEPGVVGERDVARETSGYLLPLGCRERVAFLPQREADDVGIKHVVGVVTDIVRESSSLQLREERFGELEPPGP